MFGETAIRVNLRMVDGFEALPELTSVRRSGTLAIVLNGVGLITAVGDPFAAATQTPAVQSLLRRVEQGGALSYPGVSSAAQPFLAALLHQQFPQRSLVIITDGLKSQEGFHQDLTTWLRVGRTANGEGPEPRPLFYPAWEVLPHEPKLPHADVISERLEALVALAGAEGGTQTAEGPLVVTSVMALLQRTFPPDNLRQHTRRLRRGDRLDPLDLIEWLEERSYEPEAQVTQKGELALRGGIVDVFPLTSPWPVRLEFFGDELESLRHFDPLTQVSREEIETILLPPGGELGLLKCGTTKGAAPAQPSLATLLDYLPRETIVLLCEPDVLAHQAGIYLEQVPEQDPFHQTWEEFLTALDARGLRTLAVSGSGELPEDKSHPSGLPPQNALLHEHPLCPPPPHPALSPDGGEGGLWSGEGDSVRFEVGEQVQSEQEAPQDLLACSLRLQFQSLDAWRPLGNRPPEPQIAEAQRREFFAQLHRWLRQGYQVHVFCNNDGERQRFREVWEEYGLGQKSLVSSPPPAAGPVAQEAAQSDHQPETTDHGPQTHLGTLARGFLFNDARLVVITDAEIFGRYKVQRPRRLKSPHAIAARSMLDINFTELEPGDFVVHLEHGIGRYLGLQTLPAATRPSLSQSPDESSGQECLVLEYAPGNADQTPPKLYVPVTEAHLVGKYVGAGKARPQLNVLGGTRWAKAKQQAENAVRDLAAELLSIQAARESQPGHAFPPDAPWQREFESSFLYEETPDQARAIQATKLDLELPKPMDRLICGDVGFGKTEVAIRAAFKAVMGGKQVAVLVPTTVLAQQHYNTFRERMADYPVRIELLSRFRTHRQQQRVVKDLAAGAVDIVIGTHRLVQEDIAFKDLGLVVIDEEQRFGVLHKEKFKRLRRLVDVLTLSATPIPRTLYLALTGARDMSTIETPPQDRLPVETIVTQFDERTIRDAIQRELNRGGQVFFLHNRVLTIDLMADRLRTLVPHARLVVGHGQMHADDLEEVMTRFVNGEADVLLSTTIIESGLDIPNANTIIIDRADRFGLSDLYQLRGRVGRYKHQAYAYLLIPRHATLLTGARKRISAIKQYSTLGSGFKIAMRDLEIRGAGNLLGPQQSGYITAVGFELYCQLLKQSVSALKGEPVKPRVQVTVRLDFLVTGQPGEESVVNRQRSVVDERSSGASATDHGPRTTDSSRVNDSSGIPKNAACLPLAYIREPQHRIDIYRKLAQATDKPALEAVRQEVRDRFGPLPPAVELLLQMAELKFLAAERNVTALETRDDRLMLTRNNDYIMVGSKFPRLTKKTTPARLKEIKKLLLAL